MKNVMLMVPLLDQGGQERICALTAHLLNEACKVTLVVFSTKGLFYDVKGLDVVDLDLGSRNGKLAKALTVLRRIHAVRKLKKHKKIQITYSFGPTANLINSLSKRKDIVWLGIRGYDALPDHGILKYLGKKADKVICCSKVMAEDVGNMLGIGMTDYLYNPCDIDTYRELSKKSIDQMDMLFFHEGDPVIMSVGRATDRKEFWHQVKSFAMVKKEVPNARLVLVGDGDFEGYKKLANDLGIRDSILFTGVRENPFSYLKYASVYWMTSAAEGFPNALVEALSIGIPVLSVNCKTGPAEILMEDYKKAENQHQVIYGEYGILLPIMNPLKNLEAQVTEPEECVLAEETIKVLKNAKLLKEMGIKAKKRSEDFGVIQYRDALLRKVYEV